MGHEIYANYDQGVLFPPTLEVLLPDEHPVKITREFLVAF